MVCMKHWDSIYLYRLTEICFIRFYFMYVYQCLEFCIIYIMRSRRRMNTRAYPTKYEMKMEIDKDEDDGNHRTATNILSYEMKRCIAPAISINVINFINVSFCIWFSSYFQVHIPCSMLYASGFMLIFRCARMCLLHPLPSLRFNPTRFVCFLVLSLFFLCCR